MLIHSKHPKNSSNSQYIISEKCVACGACKVVCPPHAISKGTPYVINQSKCMHCGRCAKRCHRKAIFCVAI